MKELILANTNLVALVDDEDYERVFDYRWKYCPERGVRFLSSKRKRYITLSRLVMNVLDTPNCDVDHANHNRLDNRKENLRVCSIQQNMSNRRGWGLYPKGVKKDKRRRNSFEARVHFNGRYIHLGTFSSVEAAKEAYDKKAKELYGEFYCP